MKFETIVIGAGLAGLTASIRLAEEGRKVAIISAGQSALHFNSGSLGLLGFDAEHKPVVSPADAAASLPAAHPYNKIGLQSLACYAEAAAGLLSRAGIKTDGSHSQNHQRVSPLGILRPAWLTLDGLLTLDWLKALPSPNVAIVGIAGFLDFYPRFIAASLTKEGCKCDLLTVDTPDLRHLRKSETEMRAANIARNLHGDKLIRFAEALHDVAKSSDAAALIIPAVIDLSDEDEAARFNSAVGRPVIFATTMGVSVPGIIMHTRLMRRFKALGGRLFNGHRVTGADFKEDRLDAVYTDKLDDYALRADDFIFAGGSFFSRGIVATPDAVTQPVLGLDTMAPADRSKWFETDLLGVQPIMDAGVATDASLRALRSGSPVNNLYAVGSVLAGADSLRNDSGAGVAMLTALAVADKIIKHQ